MHATEEMVVLVYAVMCMYMESDPNLWNPGTATSTATYTPPRSDARLRVSMESLRVRECYSKMKNEKEKKTINIIKKS